MIAAMRHNADFRMIGGLPHSITIVNSLVNSCGMRIGVAWFLTALATVASAARHEPASEFVHVALKLLSTASQRR
jgi:hypothetical protein